LEKIIFQKNLIFPLILWENRSILEARHEIVFMFNY
jgi:hypothetical protein